MSTSPVRKPRVKPAKSIGPLAHGLVKIVQGKAVDHYTSITTRWRRCHAPLSSAPDGLHAGFLAILLRIQRHGQLYFRHLKCPDRREEAVTDMVALCWKWFARLS